MQAQGLARRLRRTFLDSGWAQGVMYALLLLAFLLLAKALAVD